MDINEKDTETGNSKAVRPEENQVLEKKAKDFSDNSTEEEKLNYENDKLNSGTSENNEEKENDDGSEDDNDHVISFEYDVKNEEEERAFLVFQKKYVYKHNWMITAAFGIVAFVFILSIIKSPGGYLNWVLCFLCLSVIFITWYNTRRIRKYLMKALKTLEDDKYIFTLYSDRFKIETIMTEEEKAEEDFEPIPPRIVNFSDISLNVIENQEMFIIILKKETIYVLAKRVMNDEQIKILRSSFSELLGEDFESM